MQDFVTQALGREGGMLGTWVKIPSIESVQMLARAGFDFVVIDMEHAPLSLQRAGELVFCAQAMGMAALVRMADSTATTIQPLLDAGADGLLVPRVTSLDTAREVTRRMVFAPAGQRGLGTTSRAGEWGTGDMQAYLHRGDSQCARFIQLEDWQSLEAAAQFAALDHVNGIFIGHGDLYLSSGKPAADPAVRALTAQVLAATKEAGVMSAAAAATPDDARRYLGMGFTLVMVSNDLTLFCNAAAQAVEAVRGG
ncbi:aldolase/citrate lyase family protein [Alteraurantiacibacter aestuarii]|uniref:HpcH/HpaI aldolase family protein n=1 Tax=Alteraurantiacibacter aestuarii TaxID=650004 RepID=UPI0031DD6014